MEIKGAINPKWWFTPLVWLFFCPRKWAEHIHSLSSDLPSDFTLLQLYRLELHKGAVLKFYRTLAITRLLVVVVFVLLIHIALDTPLYSMLFGVSLTVGVVVFGGAMADILMSVAAGSIGVVVSGTIAGVGYGLAGHNGFTGIFANSPAHIFVLMAAVITGIGSTSSFSIITWKKETADPRITSHLGIILTGITLALLFASLAVYTTYLLANRSIANFNFGLLMALSISFFTVGIVWLNSTKRLPVLLIFMPLISVFTASMASLGYYLDAHQNIDSMQWTILYGLSIGISDGIIICGLYGVVFAFTKYLSGLLSAVFAALFSLMGAILTFSVIVNEYPLLDAILTIAVCGLIGYFLNSIRSILCHPAYSIYNLLLLRVAEYKKNINLYRINTAFLDEYALYPQVCLFEHTIFTIENAGSGEILRAQSQLRTRHHQTINKALVEHETRLLEKCESASHIAVNHTTQNIYSTHKSTSLAFFRTLSNDVSIAIQQTNPYTKKLYLEEFSNRLAKYVAGFNHNATGDKRLTELAIEWNNILYSYAKKIEQSEHQNKNIVNPYIVAVPLTIDQSIFVGREDIAQKIERLVLADIHSPLLLHGPRRIGKTSLLNNLSNILPSSIVPMFVDLQGPAANSRDNASFLYRLTFSASRSAKKISNIDLPNIDRQDFEQDPFGKFEQWLDTLEKTLSDQNKIGLLTLDEFEALHNNFLKTSNLVADEILGMLRHMIQHRKCIKLLLASSFRASTFSMWSNYLVNLRPVVVRYLSREDSDVLITRPIKGFPLKYTEDATTTIYKLTRGHPALLQLLCSSIVDAVNSRDEKISLVSEKFVEGVVSKDMLNENMFFFEDIERTQTNDAGRILLASIATHNGPLARAEICIPDYDSNAIDLVLNDLMDRDVLEVSNNCYSFQVELIRRWFLYKATQ